jgi:hypothetical protein
MNSRDRIFLNENWHIDCRLVAELPEDSVVGIRFLIYAVSCVIAILAVLITGYLGYSDINIRHQIDGWNNKIEEDKWEMLAIKIRQRYYEAESKKVESAYNEIRNPVFVSGIITELGRKLPDRMQIDSIDWNEGIMTLRGGLRDTSEHASMILGAFVDTLRADSEIGPHFSSINLTGADRSSDDDQMMVFQVTLHQKPRSL